MPDNVRKNDRFQLSFSPQVREKMDALAREQGLTRSAFMTLLVNQEWERKGGRLTGQVMMDELGK